MYNIITANMWPKGVYSSHNDIYVSNINFNFTFGIFNDYFSWRQPILTLFGKFSHCALQVILNFEKKQVKQR